MARNTIFRLSTNLHVPDADDMFEAACRARENSKHEYNWLLNDIVIAMDAQANAGSTYLYYEFQQWRSEALYYATSGLHSPADIMRRWKEIVDIFYNIIATLKERRFQVFFQENHPVYLVVGWDVNNRVGDLLATSQRAPNDDAKSDAYNPQYEVPNMLPIGNEDGIARRLQNMIESDPRKDPLSEQYMT